MALWSRHNRELPCVIIKHSKDVRNGIKIKSISKLYKKYINKYKYTWLSFKIMYAKGFKTIVFISVLRQTNTRDTSSSTRETETDGWSLEMERRSEEFPKDPTLQQISFYPVCL